MKKFLIIFSVFFGVLGLYSQSYASIYGGQYDNSGSITAIGTYPIRVDTALGQASTTQSTGDAWLIIDVASCTPDCDFYTANGGDGGWKINDGTTNYTTDYQGWKWQDGSGHLDSWKITQTGKVGLKFSGLKWETGKTYTLRWGTYDSPGGLTLKANAGGTIPTYQLSDTYIWENPPTPTPGGSTSTISSADAISILTPIVTSLKNNLIAVLPYVIPFGIVLIFLAGAVGFIFARTKGWFHRR